MPYVYLRDRYVAEEEATVSIEERAFRFGDGIFETIGVYGGVPYQWELHMLRIEAGLDAIRLPFNTSLLRPLCVDLLARNQIEDGFLRINISRGMGSRGYLPTEAAQKYPLLLIEAKPRTHAPRDMIHLWLSNYRKIPAQCLPTHAKNSQGLNATLARMEAREHHCFEALQLNLQDQLSECSSSTLFWFKDGTLYTPSLYAGMLNGTTRLAILRVSPFPVVEDLFPVDALQAAEEVFVTNVAWQVRPVSALEPTGFYWHRRRIADQLQHLLEEDIAQYVASH
jgi:branched-subunit amino acid aminotransferase/4-amino-4-deoxychorismate lyase